VPFFRAAQVKTQFGSQPQIYNQFLEIMKNFKAQT
jgi:histone deacetylase complex regulatory component SIN3